MGTFLEPCNEMVRHFRMEGKQSIIQPKDLGLANGVMNLATPHDKVMSLRGMFVPPYASQNFQFDIRLMGEEVRTTEWVWYPNMLFRAGMVQNLEVSSVTALAGKCGSAVMMITVHNGSEHDVLAPWMIHLDGGVDYAHAWEFAYPNNLNRRGDLTITDNQMMMINAFKSYGISSTLEKLRWFPPAKFWETKQYIKAGESVTVSFTFHLGTPEYVGNAMKRNPEEMLQSAHEELNEKVNWVFTKIPAFSCSNKSLENFYYRGLTSLLMNTWHVKEFLMDPYFSTGGVNGGCIGSYLWDFSAGAKTLIMFEPEGTKRQIKQYFVNDIFKSFAFSPVNGEPFGPWYMVNQEKIIDMVYQYVKITGDIAFLSEKAGQKCIMDWVEENAMFGCKEGKAGLIDYGVDGESHLELRKGVPYHGILPDLNARRYASFQKAAELARLAGRDNSKYLILAEDLKQLVHDQLWDDENKWLWFIADGTKRHRYTVEMFEFCDSDVLEPEMLDGLLAHINENEFLSEFGIHSMSKRDAAYDQVDIDCGGGGACCIFPIIIAEKLCRAGRYDVADDIMHRILWWGDRMPYWGDSLVANYIDYRQDTPLQCAIGSCSSAQYMIYGVCGIEIGSDGSVWVNPHLPNFTENMSLSHICLRGKEFSVELRSDSYVVIQGESRQKTAYGEKTLIK